MELDNLKKSWQEANIKPTLDEDKIQYMINNKGHSAFNSLLKYERTMLMLFFVCIPLSFVFRDNFLTISYLCSITVGFIWGVYKYRFLKKIDFISMDIIEISTRITKYKKFFFCEIIVSIVWGIAFLSLWAFRTFFKDATNLIQSGTDKVYIGYLLLIFMTILCIIVLITSVMISYSIYKRYALKNIKDIQKAIKEIQEFEKENNN